MIVWAVLGAVGAFALYEVIKNWGKIQDRSRALGFAPPTFSSLQYPIVTTDPGVDTTHLIGQLPCPTNPPPPDGFAIWTGSVSPAVSAWSKHVLITYPMGTFVQDIVDGQLVAARVEWHTWRGATGETGICIKGVTLFQPNS